MNLSKNDPVETINISDDESTPQSANSPPPIGVIRSNTTGIIKVEPLSCIEGPIGTISSDTAAAPLYIVIKEEAPHNLSIDSNIKTDKDHEKDECLESESLSNIESESDDEDEYRTLYCKNCKLETSMIYSPDYHNFICQSCKNLLLGPSGFKIVESFNEYGLVLYVTRDMFIYLAQYDFIKSLMEIYGERIYISTNYKKFPVFTNNGGIPFRLSFPQMNSHIFN